MECQVTGERTKIQAKYPFFNLGQPPIVPPEWFLQFHCNVGIWQWNPRVYLYQSAKQKHGGILGFALRTELRFQAVLGANVLDELLLSPELIPETWKSKKILFLGTEYQDSQGQVHIRYLEYQKKNGWIWDSVRLLDLLGWDFYVPLKS